MSNPSKAKGTRAETKVRRYFDDRGLRCERKALAGSNDEGDLRLFLPNMLEEVTVEVKAGKQTANYNRTQLDEWKRQTLDEAINSHHPAILVVVRYRRKLEDAEVWIPNVTEDGIRAWTMVYLDEFVNVVKGETDAPRIAE